MLVTFSYDIWHTDEKLGSSPETNLKNVPSANVQWKGVWNKDLQQNHFNRDKTEKQSSWHTHPNQPSEMGLDGTHVMMQTEKVEPTSLVVVSKGCYKKKETSTKKIGGSS